MFFGPKSTLGRPRVDCICHSGHFWARSKNRRFSMRPRGVQKSEKSDLGAPKGRKNTPEREQVDGPVADGVPIRGKKGSRIEERGR